jgi:hypothetical protein
MIHARPDMVVDEKSVIGECSLWHPLEKPDSDLIRCVHDVKEPNV